jgi:hypothetical protein
MKLKNNKSQKDTSTPVVNHKMKNRGLCVDKNGITVDTTDEAFSGGVILDIRGIIDYWNKI